MMGWEQKLRREKHIVCGLFRGWVERSANIAFISWQICFQSQYEGGGGRPARRWRILNEFNVNLATEPELM